MSQSLPIVEERQVKRTDQADGLLSMEDLIKRHIAGIEKLKDEVKETREMLTDSFTNNPTYREHEEKVKEATKARNRLKLEISKQPAVAQIDQKLKDLRFDLNENKKTLSDLLLDYKGQTGVTQLELFDGQVVDIIESAKIVRKMSVYK